MQTKWLKRHLLIQQQTSEIQQDLQVSIEELQSKEREKEMQEESD